MIDLLEIGINNLIESADGGEYEEALQYLSMPDFLEAIYNGLSLEPASYGICNSGYGCGNGPTTLYRGSDTRTGWTSNTMCQTHACYAMFNGIEARARSLHNGTSACDEYEVARNALVESLVLADHMHRRILLPTELWPELMPEETCNICTLGIINTDQARGQAYTGVLANIADGTYARVHQGCSWKCDHCNTRYASSRTGYNRNRHHVQVTDGENYTQGAWCATCWEDQTNLEGTHYTSCDRCGIYITGDEDTQLTVYSELSGEDVCLSCYEDGIDCDDCGYRMYEGRNHECEYDDYDSDDDNDDIHSYGYRPHPIFHGVVGPYMGFELEVESKGSNRSDGVDLFSNLDPREQRYYLKHDGSLSYGFEIVTHPHNLAEYHKLDWTWLDRLTKLGFRSWNTSSCGLHVHIGVDAFKDEAHQIRFTKFIYDNERQAKRIAGRSSGYAAFDSKGQVIPKIKYKHRDTNRYTAVNVQNEKTLEVRIFRGSLRKERVLSAIEFTHAVCEYTRDLKIMPKSKPFSWLRFSAYIANNDELYPNLFTIINETFELAREIDNQQDGDDN